MKKIPTWWTQLPDDDPILTGWLGGPTAAEYENATDEELLAMALQSLAAAFAKPVDVIERKLKAHKSQNWSQRANAFGGYSYNRTESRSAKKLFELPVEQTIFFAGEAFFPGNTVGTVEAALVSGRDAALKIFATIILNSGTDFSEKR
jgi:monoamine oxidase